MVRKRIALLCGQPEEYCQDLLIQGFNQVAMSNDYDVCVFAMYQKYQDSLQREVGETSVFDIINYSRFCAVVVLADTIQTPGVIENIEETLEKNFDGPVLFIEGETTRFPVELQDNYHPIKKLITHLIEVHNYTDIAFLTGKSWHPHSKKRLQAYKDTMMEHGLQVREDRIFYGDFWYTSGESVADTLTKHNKKLPQAIACANDAMALGLAKALSAKGVKIPEDIAVIGYDSNEEGKHAPIPLTSADIPLFDFGKHAAGDIINMINGGEPTEFVSDQDLFIGLTCGCNGNSIKPDYKVRDMWDTQLSESGVYSVFNHMSEDVVNQLSFTSLINTIFSYVYQIRPFDLFSLCINNNWKEKNDGFNSELLQVIRCGSSASRDTVNFDVLYNRDLILPDLYEDNEKPRVYYFMPFAFDDKIFGFTVVAYSDPSKCITETFRTWSRSCITGFEVFRRIDDDARNDKILRDGLVKDSLTGIYNYQGLLSEGTYIIGKMRNKGCYVSALALDVKDLSLINEKFGRTAGDKAIVSVASLLESVFRDTDSVCACLGNGEFVALKLTTTTGDTEMLMSYDKLKEKLNTYNSDQAVTARIFLYYGIETGAPESMNELERLINTAISKKNSNKIKIGKAEITGLTADEKEKSLIVNEILESNRLNYHFQPIVKASDGEIFAYEALMRADVNPYIDPPMIIRYASLSDRLSDVEYETFANVIDIVEQRTDIFDGTRKVFINSIPGQRIPEKYLGEIINRIKNLNGAVVVELTEQSELSDEELTRLKRLYAEMGVDTAVDDYGTGYSNVTNLLRYMPKYVKIDRMLLTDIQQSPQKQHFVKDIISFSQDNGIITLAEGVETSDELRTVIMLGVDLIQGYYTGRPSGTIVESIDINVKREIREHRLKYESSGTDSVFVAGREGRVMLTKLNEQGVEVISVSRSEATFIDFSLFGSPELMTKIVMKITNGYKGRITLENVGLGMNAQAPAISIDKNSDVTLVFKGNNKFLNGIYVAPGSQVHIEGDGDLNISVSKEEFFCIGAGSDQRHGDIIIENYEGTINLNGNGVKGAGIGSELGGNVVINKANVKINIPGRTTVGIGNVSGESDIKINESDVSVIVRSMACVAIGSHDGFADIKISDSNIDAVVEGMNAMLMGNFEYTVKPDIKNSTVNSLLNTVMVKENSSASNSIYFLNGEYKFDGNGERSPS